MRTKFINYLKRHPIFLRLFWIVFGFFLKIISIFVKKNQKMALFVSLGGRNYGDSPRAIYEYMLNLNFYKDWSFVWAFVDVKKYDIPRGEIVKIDSFKYFIYLLKSKVWICNSGIDRGLKIQRKDIIRVETWHGTPLKKIYGDENKTAIGGKTKKNRKTKIDRKTIRCAQSEKDIELYSRLFSADPKCFLKGLPRNDRLTHINEDEIRRIKSALGIPFDKKVILYAPTFREYSWDEQKELIFAPPLTIAKWEKELGDEYILIFRAHYAVMKSLSIVEDNFVKDFSAYPCIEDLYLVSDILISDYSSAFIDFSILERPMLCFAYDYDEYCQKRGLYYNLQGILPCNVDFSEDIIISRIKNLDFKKESLRSLSFKRCFAKWSGEGTKNVVEKINSLLNN